MNNRKPQITIVIPVFNAGKFIAKCLDSIIMQSFGDFEVLLVDDGSSDNTRDVCSDYINKDTRFRYYQEKHRGVSATRNKGIEKAGGEYITFIDADDWVEKHYLETMYGLITSQESDYVIGGFVIHKNDVITENSVEQRCPCLTGSADIRMCLIRELLANASIGGLYSRLFKTKLVADNGIEFDESLNISEDVIFNLDYLIKAKAVSIMNQNPYHYIKHAGSLMTLTENNTVERVNRVVSRRLDYIHYSDDADSAEKDIYAWKLKILTYRLIKNMSDFSYSNYSLRKKLTVPICTEIKSQILKRRPDISEFGNKAKFFLMFVVRNNFISNSIVLAAHLRSLMSIKAKGR